jgi:hypothetical protein
MGKGFGETGVGIGWRIRRKLGEKRGLWEERVGKRDREREVEGMIGCGREWSQF